MGCHALDIRGGSVVSMVNRSYRCFRGCALIRTGCLQTGERYREGRERPISHIHIFIYRY